jgi:two-component system CheB/CheR fusion protein
MTVETVIPPPLGRHSPLVGLGGSAGGLVALQEFFRAVPPQSGLAYVVVMHLSPAQDSNLAAVLQYGTSMPVRQVTETVAIEPDHVYVIAPGRALAAVNGSLELRDLPEGIGPRMTVDILFRTLAESYGQDAIAVVLSGMDGDGALGIQRVKEFGGLGVAQDPSEAGHPSMPRTAIATGMVDWVLPVADMPARLIDYVNRGRALKLPEDGPAPAPGTAPPPAPLDTEAPLRGILSFLRVRSGRDFSNYKRATVLRRIARRMRVNAVETLQAYLQYLHLHPGEAQALLQDLLISVTNFFRDPEEFEALAARIGTLFDGKGPGEAVRVWVPACATGEEAYSLAILLHEHARTLEAPPAIQIFATDLDDHAIHVARQALYPPTIAADVSPERLRRFFTQVERGYCIRREVRDSVLFAMHDVLGDSPFSRIDLVSCRNLLIYLTREAQSRVLDIFHFSLRPRGLLFLGSSESVEDGHHLFAQGERKHHLYTSRTLVRTPPMPIGGGAFRGPAWFPARSVGEMPMAASGTGPLVPTGEHALAAAPPRRERAASWSELHYRLLERLSPPSILISGQLEIVHVSESAGRFLQFSAGEPTRDIFRSIHPAFRLELRAALYRARQSGQPTETPPVPLQIDGAVHRVSARVATCESDATEMLLITFDARPGEPQTAQDVVIDAVPHEPATSLLEAELDRVRAQLRDVIERAEVSLEELKASNEELQAMNEELRSATEELETGREELLSLNEELTLVNAELTTSVEYLAQVNGDLQNLMAATAIATVFLDRALRVKRFTPSALALFHLIPSDVGRPLEDLKSELDFGQIRGDAEQALQQLQTCEREVHVGERWFIARTTPYRTEDDHIAGVVLTFIDVTDNKRTHETARASSELLRLVIENAREYVIVSTDLQRRVTTWNSGAERLLGFRAEEIIGKSADVIFTEEDRAALVPQREADTALRDGRAADERWHVRRDGSRFWGSGVMMVLRNDAGEAVGLAKIFRDQTDVRLAVQQLEQSRNDAQAATQAKDRFLAVLSHELRTPLSPVVLALDALSGRDDMAPGAHKLLETMRRNVMALTYMIQDLLDITRISSGKLEIARDPVDVHTVVHAAIEVCESALQARQQRLELSLEAEHTGVVGDFERLRQALWNLLQNASKFSPVASTIRLRTYNAGAHTVCVAVQDNGIGIDPSARDRIFDAFTQADSRITREFGGLGLGLAIVQGCVHAHGGTVRVSSEGPGTGARFEIELPVAAEAPSSEGAT